MSDCARYGHLLIVTVQRRWLRRDRHFIRCAVCDTVVSEP